MTRTYFNPHEREARDTPRIAAGAPVTDFNPHEREARDVQPFAFGERRKHFNPHEREARDVRCFCYCQISVILIHTSVKLVTQVKRPT